MTRQIEKKDNFFTMSVKEGEMVSISVDKGDDPKSIVFIVPFDCTLNTYVKRNSVALEYREQ